MNNSKDIKIILSDALLLASIPILAYIIFFTFEIGFITAYRVPAQYISFSWGELFYATFSLIFILIPIYSVVDFILNLIPESIPAPVRRRIKVFIVLIFSTGTDYLIFPKERTVWIILLFLTVIFLINFIPPISKKYQGTYSQRLEGVDKENQKRFGKIEVNALGTKIAPNVAIFFYMLFLIYTLGFSLATNNRTYRVATTIPEMVVVYVDYNKFILMPFDRNTKLLDPSFTIINTGDEPSLQFRSEDIGPLTLAGNTISPIQLIFSQKTKIP